MSDREKEEWAQAGAESPDDVDAGDRTSTSRKADWAKGTARSPDDADADTAAGKAAGKDKPGGR
ncbi:hypothetical protein [Azospirillum sp. ST 5-10]|uniref:hypothetical protein n=1 Tax=unclassified Azospirillum TaxID=2630922 RepID=UPI003F4A4B2E